MSNTQFVAQALTQGPKYHLFGYYGITPWDASGRHIACLEVDFQDRLTNKDDVAVIGLVDPTARRFEPLAETRGWNLQQGCMLHWLPTAPDQVLTFNDRAPGPDGSERFVSVLLDIHTGERRTLPYPISGMSHDGSMALGLNYARLREQRAVVGYAGLADPRADQTHPTEDGVYLMDVESGEGKLLISYDQVFRFLCEPEEMQRHNMWFNHTQFNMDDTRFCFVVRWRPQGVRGNKTIFMTAGVDGGALCVVSETGASHFDWLSAQEIFVAGHDIMGKGDHWFLINDATGDYRILGKGVAKGGHCCFSYDRKWILADGSGGPDQRTLSLWNMDEERMVPLGSFYSNPALTGDWRCDLHPRWSRDDRWICFDSSHEVRRQVYIMDVSAVTKA